MHIARSQGLQTLRLGEGTFMFDLSLSTGARQIQI